MIGMVLGDGSIYRHSYTPKSKYLFKCSHSMRQKGYLDYKMGIVQNIFDYPLSIRDTEHTSDGKKKFPVCVLQTRVHSRFNVLGDHLYKYEDGKRIKTFSNYAYNFLTKEGFAYYYMDDGCLSIDRRRVKSGQMILGTYGFSIDDVHLMRDWVSKEFSVEFSVRKHKDCHILARGYKYTEDLLDELSQYSPDCMKYKFSLRQRRTL